MSAILARATRQVRARPGLHFGLSALFHLPLVAYALLVVSGLATWRFATGFGLTLATDVLAVSVYSALIQRAGDDEARGAGFSLRAAARAVLPRAPQVMLVAFLRLVWAVGAGLIPVLGLALVIFVYARGAIAVPCCAIDGGDTTSIRERVIALTAAPSVPLVRLVMLVGALPQAIQLAFELLAQSGLLAAAVPRITTVVIAILVTPVSSAALGFAYQRLRWEGTPRESRLAEAFD